MKATHYIPLSLVMTFFSLPVIAVDLTGSWLGKLTCIYNDGFKGSYVANQVLIDITQTGDDILLDWGGDGNADASGFVIDDKKKPFTNGQAALVYCAITTGFGNNADSYGEILNLSGNIDRSRIRGSLKGRSIYAYPPSNPPSAEIGECRWSFKLISTTDPSVAACI